MAAISLQSGSNGNCIYVSTADGGFLFDAGIPGVRAETRLAAHGLDIRDTAALIVSHDHADHTRSAGVYQRKFGVPLYCTATTLEAAESRVGLGRLSDVRYFRSGDTINFGSTEIETIPTPHDGRDGSAFVVSSGGVRLGILTDLGHCFEGLRETLSTLDAVFIESNYDTGMLKQGPYPAFLKRRIQGEGGHLSNTEAAELLADSGGRLRWACLSHLSQQNNYPELALRTHMEILGGGPALHVASRYGATDMFYI